jgi:hypothetical protein
MFDQVERLRDITVSKASMCPKALFFPSPNDSYHNFLGIIAFMCGLFTQAYARRDLY